MHVEETIVDKVDGGVGSINKFKNKIFHNTFHILPYIFRTCI